MKSLPIAEQLAQFTHFKKLDPAARERLAEFVHRLEIAAEENLVHEGDEMDAVYFVVSGALAVFRDTVGSPVVLLRRLYPGDFFGIVALFGDGRHGATVRSSEKTTLMRLPKQDLLRFLAGQPELRADLESRAAQQHSANLAAALEVERGREVRMRLHHAVELTLEDGTSHSSYLENLSIGGFCLTAAPKSWQPEADVRFGLGFSAGTLDLAGRIAWRRRDTVGLQFTRMSANHDVLIQLSIRLLLESATAHASPPPAP